MTNQQLVAVLEGMDPNLTVHATVRDGEKIRGVNTDTIDGKKVIVIR